MQDLTNEFELLNGMSNFGFEFDVGKHKFALSLKEPFKNYKDDELITCLNELDYLGSKTLIFKVVDYLFEKIVTKDGMFYPYIDDQIKNYETYKQEKLTDVNENVMKLFELKISKAKNAVNYSSIKNMNIKVTRKYLESLTQSIKDMNIKVVS